MNIKDDIEIKLKDIKISTILTTGEFKALFDDTKNSYIPTDYCYNRRNNGIPYETQPKYFIYLSRGKFQYVGKTYKYSGPVFHKPKGTKKDIEVGCCKNGAYIAY